VDNLKLPFQLIRFRDRIQADHNTGCWIWMGLAAIEYPPRLTIKGKRQPMHRHFYEAMVGPILEDYQAHHKCRRRACVNPEHIQPLPFEEHRQQMCHARPGGTRFTEQEISEIRFLYLQPGGLTRKTIAQIFKVTSNVLDPILQGRTWRDIKPLEITFCGGVDK